MIVSVCIITRDRSAELSLTLDSLLPELGPQDEVLVWDNGSQPAELSALRQVILRDARIVLHASPTNLGVSGGRNELLRRANGEIIWELDDDADIGTKGVTRIVEEIFSENKTVAVVACRLVNRWSQKIDRAEYPFLNKKRDDRVSGYSCWFIGCSHMFRRSALNEIGVYRNFFPYSQEEIDLSIRFLDAGYEIWYEADITVFHRKSPTHRIVDPTAWGTLNLKNRVKVALFNLPWPCVITYYFVRGIQWSKFGRHPAIFMNAFRMLRAEWIEIMATRQCIRWQTCWKLLQRNGPFFF